MKSQHIGKDYDAGKNLKQKERRAAEDEIVRYHHQLSEHEFEQTLVNGGGDRKSTRLNSRHNA